MCLALPRRVLHIQDDRVQVDWDGEPLWAGSGGVLDLEPGEYVLVHAGLVLDRIPADEAEEILALYAILESAEDDVPPGHSAVEAMR